MAEGGKSKDSGNLKEGDVFAEIEKNLSKSQTDEKDGILSLMTELRDNINKSNWLQDRNAEVAQSMNSEKGKETLDLDFDLDAMETVQVGTSKGGEEGQIMDLLTELRQNIKGTNWLEEQTKAVKAGASITTPAEQAASAALDLSDEFEILSATGGKADPLADLMKGLHNSITTSDWLQENTVDKMKRQNPDLIASIIESRSKEGGDDVEKE